MTNINNLLLYLEKCGNKDRNMFYNSEGKPDIDAAREFAEKMRLKLEDMVGSMITIKQRNHAVDIELSEEAVAIAK